MNELFFLVVKIIGLLKELSSEFKEILPIRKKSNNLEGTFYPCLHGSIPLYHACQIVNNHVSLWSRGRNSFVGSSRAPSDVSASDGSIFDISKPSKPDLIETRVSLSNNSDPQVPKGDFYPTLNLIARLQKKEVI